jgi:NADH dehydrogenase FAD-containing subunit
MNDRRPVVIIVGGGFGGLAAAKALRNAPVQVFLIDRTNHYLFQPLLYQVATSVLSPEQIASPLREILHKQRNTTVLMGEVVGVDKDRKLVLANSTDRERVPVPYDYLILATGATHSYFGHKEFEKYAPGLKSLADAVTVRNKILQAFESAEAEEDPRAHRDLLTFVLVGGGPAGVEMAGAIAVMVRGSLRSRFRRIDPRCARVVLIDRSKKLLGTYADELSNGAKKRLEKLGVEVRLEQSVDLVDADGVLVGGERIQSKTVIWTAGVMPSPAGKWLDMETDHAGRVRSQPDLSVPGHPEIFVVGDSATLNQDGQPLGGVAQVAMQQGRYAGHVIHRLVTGKPAPKPFRYFDKGTMAVVGLGYAVLQTGRLHLKGYVAWLAWAVVHVLSLAQPALRISVFSQWVWTYFTRQRGSWLIVNPHGTASASRTSETPACEVTPRET